MGADTKGQCWESMVEAGLVMDHGALRRTSTERGMAQMFKTLREREAGRGRMVGEHGEHGAPRRTFHTKRLNYFQDSIGKCAVVRRD
jgi:hypothetical protein